MTPEFANYRKIFAWSFTLRYSAGLLAWFATRVMEIPFMEDAFYYEERGAIVAEDWLAGRSSEWLNTAMQSTGQPWLIVLVIAGFYFICGGLRLLPLLLAFYCSISALTPLLTFKIAKQLGVSPAAALKGTWLVVFSPCFAIWSGALYKEGLILLFLNLSIYQLLLLQSKFRLGSMLVLVSALAALFALRFYLAIILALIVPVGISLGRAGRNYQGAWLMVMIRQVLILTVLLAGGAVIISAWGIGGQVQSLLTMDIAESLSKLDSSRVGLASSTSGYLRGTTLNSWEDAVAFLPVGIVYFLTVPWPWQIGSLRQNIVILENSFWLMIYPILFVGMARGLRRNFQGTVIIIMATVLVSAFYGLWISNIGTAYRLRIQIWLLWSVFFGWGREPWRRSRGYATGPAFPEFPIPWAGIIPPIARGQIPGPSVGHNGGRPPQANRP